MLVLSKVISSNKGPLAEAVVGIASVTTPVYLPRSWEPAGGASAAEIEPQGKDANERKVAIKGANEKNKKLLRTPL